MPEVEGVSVGAIRSNYQRVRVEHVFVVLNIVSHTSIRPDLRQNILHSNRCQRLGLIPIAYLWERNQEELLHEMIHAGMNCILLKVAGAGSAFLAQLLPRIDLKSSAVLIDYESNI